MARRTLFLVALPLCLLAIVGCVNHMQLGIEAFNRGEYDKSAFHWNDIAKSGNPYAQYNLGLLWEGGLGSTPLNTAEASQWYLRSAQQGFVPAMVRLANLQIAAGYEEAALSWLVLAARWGNNDAIKALTSMGKPVPPSDLLAQKQYYDLLAEARAAQEAASMSAALGQVLGCIIAGGNCESSPSVPSPTVYGSTTPSVAIPKQCTSDYSCGFGFTCVKAPLKSTGICMKSVNESGMQQYNTPSDESIGPNMNLDGQCQFDTDCPIGFRCDRTYKVCVKR